MNTQESSDSNGSPTTKKRIHRLAVWSIIVGGTGLLVPYILWYIGFGLCWRDGWVAMLFAQILAVLSLISFIGLGGMGISLGIIALVKIRISNGAFSGKGISIVGIIGGTTVFVIFIGVSDSLFWIFKGLSELFA